MNNPCSHCGADMALNHHPDEGLPAYLSTVGAQYVCIPCTVRTRHEAGLLAFHYRQALEKIVEMIPTVVPEAKQEKFGKIHWRGADMHEIARRALEH